MSIVAAEAGAREGGDMPSCRHAVLVLAAHDTTCSILVQAMMEAEEV